jgi:hypothetical protein
LSRFIGVGEKITPHNSLTLNLDAPEFASKIWKRAYPGSHRFMRNLQV